MESSQRIPSLVCRSGLFDSIGDRNEKGHLRVLVACLVDSVARDRGAFDAIVLGGILRMRSHVVAKCDPAPVNVALGRYQVEKDGERLSPSARGSDQQREKMTKRARLKTESSQNGAQRRVVRFGCRDTDVEDIPAAQARDRGAPDMLDPNSEQLSPQERRYVLEDVRQIGIVGMVFGFRRRSVRPRDSDQGY